MKLSQSLAVFGVTLMASFGVMAQQNLQSHSQPRIVSTGGSVTETLYALGLGDYVVAVDTSSSFPNAVNALPKVGYYRQLSAEGILSMRPDILVGHTNTGPQATLDALQRAGVELAMMHAPQDVEGVLTTISALADRFDRQQAGEQLIQKIHQQLKLAETNNSSSSPKVGLLLTGGQRGLTAAGIGTMPDDIISHAGGQNAFTSHAGYKPISKESLLTAQPDVLLVPAHAAGEGVEALCTSAAFKLWAMQNGCNVHIVDSIMFMGMSPRVGEAVQQLHLLLAAHNQASSDNLTARSH